MGGQDGMGDGRGLWETGERRRSSGKNEGQAPIAGPPAHLLCGLVPNRPGTVPVCSPVCGPVCSQGLGTPALGI